MSDHTPYFPANITEYAPWVAKYGLFAPYGECQCGCGFAAPIAKTTRTYLGINKGKPSRFIQSHSHTVRIYAKIPYEQRFWKNVRRGSGIDDCWQWAASLDHDGYGKFTKFTGKWVRAHRFSYELHYGAIPEGIKVLHHCDNPRCVRPDHLFLGTDADNIADKVAKNRQPRGETSANAKLTNADVIEIRALKIQGMQQRTIAKLFRVCEDTISGIVLRKKWKHIP